jgi:hypothetical protein
VTSETATEMDAAEVLADQFAWGEQVLGQGSMDCSVVAVTQFCAARVFGVKHKLAPIQLSAPSVPALYTIQGIV